MTRKQTLSRVFHIFSGCKEPACLKFVKAYYHLFYIPRVSAVQALSDVTLCLIKWPVMCYPYARSHERIKNNREK